MTDWSRKRQTLAEQALVVRTPEEEAAITERKRLKAERRAIVAARRQSELKELIASVKVDAARITNLRKYMFKEDDELVAAGLTLQQRKIVRQFEEPKKATAFGVESAAKLIEAETRAQAEKSSVKVHVENMHVVQLPEKAASTVQPVVIEVEVNDK
jgi:hypothetical protein